MYAIDRLLKKIREKNNPTVMGLDPRPDLLPPVLRPQEASAEALAQAYLKFNTALLEACSDIIPAVKFQVACYEALGLAGLEALLNSQRVAKDLGYFIINDAKRSDIASSADFYARAWLTDEAWIGDALTLNPYLGKDSLEPFMKVAREYKKMLFVLLRTSNPGAHDFQDLELKQGHKFYDAVGDALATWGANDVHDSGYSDLAAVVGATWPSEGLELRKRLPSVFFLVPGYGAQGAGASEVVGTFDQNGEGALINSSRGLMGAWKSMDDPDGLLYEKATREAAIAMANELRTALSGNDKKDDSEPSEGVQHEC